MEEVVYVPGHLQGVERLSAAHKKRNLCFIDGGTGVGAALGAIAGGGKGVLIGAAAGSAAGTGEPPLLPNSR